MAFLTAVVHHVSADAALTWIGLVVVLGCLIAAGVAAWRAAWVVVGLLLLVALVTAILIA